MSESATQLRLTGRTGVHLNGATIMSTPTDRHLVIAREAGYDGVEVRAERLVAAPQEVDAAAALVREGEVWSLNGIQIKIRSDGSPERDLLAVELPPRLEVCRALRAEYLLVVPPRIAGVDFERALPAVREGLRAIRDAAARDGRRVAFEFLGFADSPIDTLARALGVIQGIPDVDLVIDSCHWHASGDGPLADFPIERLAMVHLNDAPPKPPREIEDGDRVLPGEGVIALTGLLAQLRARGYTGPWSLETFNPSYWREDPADVARRGLEATLAVLGTTPRHKG